MKYIYTTLVATLMISTLCFTSDCHGDFWPTRLTSESTSKRFGQCVAFDGDTCIVGAPNTNDGDGSAYIFSKDESGDWIQTAQFNGKVGESYFGRSVAIDGDTCVIGAPEANSNRGTAYIYAADGDGNWNQVAEFHGPAGISYFGFSSAIDGDTCVIGATRGNWTGTAHIYVSDADGNWSQVAEFAGEQVYEYFGRSVAIDGDICVVGAPENASVGTDSGKAYIYASDENGNWSQVAGLNGPSSYDYFGVSVAIDGDTCVVGAPNGNDGTGSAIIYTLDKSGNWTQVIQCNGDDANDGFGIGVGIDGDTCVIGASGTEGYTGSAYIYTLTESNWTLAAEINGGTLFNNENRYGYSVAIAGDACLIGAYGDENYTGCAYIYSGNTSLPDPSGACCVPSGCHAITETACVGMGGVWLAEKGSCDECPETQCVGDLNADGVVDVNDLLALLALWGACP